MAEDTKHSEQESRFHLLGKTNQSRKLHITFALRLKMEKIFIRVISARDMSKKEREIYEKKNDSLKKIYFKSEAARKKILGNTR